MGTLLTGEAWSLFSVSGIGSFTDFTNFQVGYLKPLRLEPDESREIAFKFNVPSRVREGATICTSVYIGQHTAHGERLDEFFDTVGQADLFCVSKESTGLYYDSAEEGSAYVAAMSGQTFTPLRKRR